MSDDDQDDNNVFDKLKSIKAFTVDQLYLLHPDVGCPPRSLASNCIESNLDIYHDKVLYQNLVDYEKLKHEHNKIREQVKRLHRELCDQIGKVWVFNKEELRKIEVCKHGKIVEETYKYKQAYTNPKQLNVLGLSFRELSEVITKDYILYSFESQVKRFRIVTQLASSYQTEDVKERSTNLKLVIGTLIDFMKHGKSKSEFATHCQKWLRCLIKRFLEEESTANYRFIISQLCKGPVGTANWSADLIERRPFPQVIGFDSEPQYLTHCCELIAELFNNLKVRLRTLVEDDSPNVNDRDQNWLLEDPRFNCNEELSMKSDNVLSETDVIKLCLRIPVVQIFRAYVEECLKSDESNLETDKNYEYTMLKLLTIGTIIVKTYQIGLEIFSSIQYGNLIEYLSLQVRRTVIILSDQWNEFKRRLKGVDNALMMRLQVEYDNFILRSILIILELRQSGIWRHLAKNDDQDPALEDTFDATNSWTTESIRPAITKILQVTGIKSVLPAPNEDLAANHQAGSKLSTIKSSTSLTNEFSIEWFKEVSEPMLWHILWQFYHNGFVNSCDYHSDSYWIEKFQDKSSIYLFLKKMKDSPIGECNHLLNSITSMVLSRPKHDSKLVVFIANEIFKLSFQNEELKDKIGKKGLQCLTRCTDRFPYLMDLFMNIMSESNIDEKVVEFVKGCNLPGWIFGDKEFGYISKWLSEYPLSSTHNKIARLLISKVLLNNAISNQLDKVTKTKRKGSKGTYIPHVTVDLTLRRRLALLLYEASVRHLPETNDYGPQSLGTFVEVALGSVFCDRKATTGCDLLELSVDISYQHFYIWIWRLLFTFKLHILNQPETDWNDVQSRSGTSRSIKNTVLLNDSFHPVPSIQDSECLLLSDGIKNSNPLAAFIYLAMTDATWQTDTLETCLIQLNVMASTGHLTPSLMTMKYLTICHLNDISERVAKDQRIIDFFTTIMLGNCDINQIASLVECQILNLKQYRQIQLSNFYIKVLLEVATNLDKQLSSSWFSGNEHSLEKIACVLDYIVKFNFPTQRLEIIRKFYDCSYSVQNNKSPGSWIGSLFTVNSSSANSTKREFLTVLHYFSQKYKKLTWLRWVTAECDTLRLEKIWEDLVLYLSTNDNVNLDSAIKKVCPHINSSILKSTLPIYNWLEQIFDIVESDWSHPLCPLILYNFFLNFFANSLNGGSVGHKLIPHETLTELKTKLDALFKRHSFKHLNQSPSNAMQQHSLAQLYRAYRLWLDDTSLRDAYIDMDKLGQDYIVPLLKAIMESSVEESCIEYIDIQSIEIQNRNLSQIWTSTTRLGTEFLNRSLVFVESDIDETDILQNLDHEVSDAVSLVRSPETNQHIAIRKNSPCLMDEEIIMTQQEDETSALPIEDLIKHLKRKSEYVFKESVMFESNLKELAKIKTEVLDIIKQLYTNKKKEVRLPKPCNEALECSAEIKFEVEEAKIDPRKSECLQDRQRQCKAIICELLALPTGKIVRSTIAIEDRVRHIVKDNDLARQVIKILLNWMSETETFKELNGSYYVANYLLNSTLEILSQSKEADIYNTELMNICFKHLGSVEIFSPHLSPASCSRECFLDLYKKIIEQHKNLSPNAMFVLLSKSKVDCWLKENKSKTMYHDLIKATCSGLKSMGKHPDDDYVLTYDLYRFHIKTELASPDRRKPEEILLVLREFLIIMDQQSLSPNLWCDFMTILGLETTKQATRRSVSGTGNKNGILRDDSVSVINEPLAVPQISSLEHDESTIANLVDSIARFAECQTIFDYQALKDIIQMISDFFIEKQISIDITLLEFYNDYLDQFSLVLMSFTFMWLKETGEHYPDNHDLTWKQFMAIWQPWVFLTKNCQNVGKTSYSLFATEFVASIRYMIDRMIDNKQKALRSVLSALTDYVKTTKEVVYLELTIMQRCLKNLPWSSLTASPEDFDNLASLSEQSNYNVSDLVSYILLHVDIKDSLTKIYESNEEVMPYVVERLATTIVLQSTHLRSFRLHGSFFSLIPVDKISTIAGLILPRMEFANLEHSQNNKLLVKLLRFICIQHSLDNGPDNHQSSSNIDDKFERSSVYARFVSSYLVDLIKNHPVALQHHKDYIRAVIDNTLQDLTILLSPDVDISRKFTIYENLLECCNNKIIGEGYRFLIADSFLNSSSMKDRPIVVMELFHSVGQIISDGCMLVYTIERMIILYLSMNGHYEKVWKSFCLKVLPSDIYLEACVEENTPLALLVYFEALYRNGNESSDNEIFTNSTKIWTSLFHWLTELCGTNYMNLTNEPQAKGTKLVVTWLKLLDMFELNMMPLIQYQQHQRKSPEKVALIANDSSPSDSDSQVDNSEQTTTNVEGDNNSFKSIKSNITNTHKSDSSPRQTLTISSGQKSLVDFVKKLVLLYDTHNAGGFWSYIKSTMTEEASHLSLIALAVACFLTTRTLVCLSNLKVETLPSRSSMNPANWIQGSGNKQSTEVMPANLAIIYEEMKKLRKSCLSKLENARKTKHYLKSTHFIEALIESMKRDDKVQYSEGVQLISTFVENIYSTSSNSKDYACLLKILT